MTFVSNLGVAWVRHVRFGERCALALSRPCGCGVSFDYTTQTVAYADE